MESDFERQVVTLRDQVVRLGDRDLARTAEELIAASRAGSSTASLLIGLADHWFSSLDDPARAERARIGLSAPAQQFDAAIRQLRTSPDGDVSTAAASIARLRDDGPFGEAIDAALAGAAPAPFVDGVDLATIVATFTDSFAALQPLLDLMAGRSDELSASARGLADESSREADRNLAALIGLGLLLVLLCLWVVRSVDRPLRQLIDAMRRVGGGDLSGSLLHHGGPPEVADASSAFNDVLVNLRLLDGKVRALAHADLDDPRVAEELPGPLGRELDASVEVLATSIADRADLQARLEHQATHDPLTGITNRAGAVTALRSAMARAQRQRSTVAVAFLDLDGFKAVNDRHGHATGDRVLVEVAARLSDQARAGDVCARLGGDEFIVIAEQMGTADDARGMGRRIRATVGRPMRLGDGRTVEIGVSVGLALWDDPTEAAADLLHRADLAAYLAKRSGTGVELAGPLDLPESADQP
ncbi:MAG: sensor domain-containing diguanylate cyclase [Acidimicrobiales bacterium]